jgi:hypothetical protein
MTQQLRSKKAHKAADKLINAIDLEKAAFTCRLKSLLAKAEAQGLVLSPPERSGTCAVMIKSGPEKNALNFGWFGCRGRRPVFRNYGIDLKDRQERTIHPLGEEYLYKLAGLLHADVYLPPEKDPFAMTVKRRTSTGWEAISLDEVVAVQEDWLALIHETLNRFATLLEQWKGLSCFTTYLLFSVSFRSFPTLVRPAGGAPAKPSLACDPSGLRPHVSGGCAALFLFAPLCPQ